MSEALGVGAGDRGGEGTQRIYNELRAGWRFARGRMGEGEAGFEAVRLPHSYNRHDALKPGHSHWQGEATYAHPLADISWRADRAYRLELGPFYGAAEVEFAGSSVGRIEGEYLGGGVDLELGLETLDAEQEASPGLRLYVENRYESSRLPGTKSPDFLLYGGLSGGVQLVELPLTHLVEESLRIETAYEASATTATVTLGCQLWNRAGTPVSGTVRASLVSPHGHVVANERQRVELDTSVPGEVRFELTLETPQLWCPENPALYVCRVESEVGERRDLLERRIGVRHALFCEDGFFLNGERVLWQGLNRHESQPGFGNALGEALHYRDAQLIKELGLNAVRLAHYPQNPAFLDACDELGLLVFAELASWKSVGGSGLARFGKWQEQALRQWRRMILRDRHRPSVMIWGMGNESRSRKIFTALKEEALALDPARPVSYAENHLHRARREKTVGLPDVWGLNYELDVLEDAREQCATRTVLVTECMNALFPETTERGMGPGEQQALAMLRDLEQIEARDWLAGWLAWCFADYATEYKQRVRRRAGMFTAFREWRLGAYLLEILLREEREPRGHLFGDWHKNESASESDERSVLVLARLPSKAIASASSSPLELRVGDQTVRSFSIADFASNGVLVERLKLQFQEAPLRLGAGGQAPIAELEPWGEPFALQVRRHERISRPGGDHGEDSLWAVWLRVIDGAGARVWDWQGTGSAQVIEGQGEVCGFDPCRFEIEAGRGVAYISAQRQGVMVELECEGLVEGRVRVQLA